MNFIKAPKITLITGSAPDAVHSKEWDKQFFDNIVVINNAWQLRDDWDYLVHPEDFPLENRPKNIRKNQRIITADEYVPVQNSFGGFVYAGGTMSLTTAYWVLGTLKPNIIAFSGCDMVYPSDGKATHFYGFGKPDPLRNDVTLNSLEAKSSRFFYTALKANCLCLNLSNNLESRLTFPRVQIDELQIMTYKLFEEKFALLKANVNEDSINAVLQRERDLGYYIESGRYWEHLDGICPIKLKDIDRFWLAI